MFFRRRDDSIRELLQSVKTIAIVGLSDDPYRASHHIASYLQSKGYRIIPVNPHVSYVLGEKAYPDLKSISVPVDLVDVFRQEEDLIPIIEEALEQKMPAIWLQLGLKSSEGEAMCLQDGALFVQNRCIMQEHRRLLG
ncbi:MAG TPA: CoA-binding protein [Syntrophomonadaceae bacterium]|nr:CoA-binding protein [Syntrophomonadaceae bacterium]